MRALIHTWPERLRFRTTARVYGFLIWPQDASRRFVWREGADVWFWLYVTVAIVFAALAVLAFTRLARSARSVVAAPIVGSRIASS